MSTAEYPAKPEGTAALLIAAALKLFGVKGFAATSTREIAAAAGTNVASIAYHFGGKDGLRKACGQEFMRRLGTAIGPDCLEAAPSPEVAVRVMESVIRAMADFLLTQSESEDLIPFMLREVTENGPVLQDIYDSMIAPTHGRFCRLWSAATGQPPESEITRLRVFSLIGPLLYFRIGRPVVARRMGWPGIGRAEARQIAEVLIANLHAIIEQERRT
jgi:TetR/AcrR family transcriptional regulator, regulator of cefoperazone and chloramphenicol sensitivity